MLVQNKSIAIVGAGPGGLTLAKLLQLKEADVKVYERDANKDARVQGSPLDLHADSGLAALAEAGLMGVFRENFMPGADKMLITNERAAISYSDHSINKPEDFGNVHFRPEIDRGVLRKILLESLDVGTVVWGSHFISMEEQNGGWILQFKDRQPVYADIVIAADGANSGIRPYVTDSKPFYSGITMLEGVVYNAKDTVPNIHALLNGGKIMALGKGRNLLMGQKGNDEIGFYASFKAGENWVRDSGLDFSDNAQVLAWFKETYPEWDAIWEELFANASAPFIPRPIYCAPLGQQWEARPNITLLGDAAHVMPPFAGEGVNMAMLDALELSRCLASGSFGTLQEAIGAYEATMRKRASAAAQESLDNGVRMHSENALEIMTAMFSDMNPA